MALYHFGPLFRIKKYSVKAVFVYLQRAGTKRKILSFGKRSLIPAFGFQSIVTDHNSTLFKIKCLMILLPRTEATIS